MPKNSQKVPKMQKLQEKIKEKIERKKNATSARKCQKKLYCIGATIHTRQEIQCLPYVEFFFSDGHQALDN